MDHVISAGRDEGSGEHSGSARRFRILAGEAHSWSALLLEDDRSQRYLYLVAEGTLQPIGLEFATSLLEGREFRPWRGRQELQPLSSLPIESGVSKSPSWLTTTIVHPEPSLGEGDPIPA